MAFFLLGNALWDAVQVCINRLNDLQLALVIARLYENDNEQTHRKIIEWYVLGYENEPPHKGEGCIILLVQTFVGRKLS